MQLELWSASARAATPADTTRQTHAARRHGAEAVPITCIDPDLVPELECDAELARLQARVMELVRQARASSTRKAYGSDWKLFECWCRTHGQVALPATRATLALYLTHLAALGRKYSTIRRARTAIGQVHCASNKSRPDQDQRIRALERGIARTIGTREQGAPPLCVAELERAVSALEADSVRDLRDRALLLLGFAGGYRSSDLVTFDVEHVRFEGAAMHVFLPRSKEDQLGRGRPKIIPTGSSAALCPVRALQRWLEFATHRTGQLFRVINGAQIRSTRMHPRAVSRAVQRATKRAGIVGDYSLHSLRAGLATLADAHGHSLRAIQQHVGWLDARTPLRYMDPSRGAARNVVVGLL